MRASLPPVVNQDVHPCHFNILIFKQSIVAVWPPHFSKALSEFVFKVLQNGRIENNGYSGNQLLHRNHENGLT
tara:strand:+ start:102805 stop:103023 length:219 start_codon:yes stop_codon:yes gene_type:complete